MARTRTIRPSFWTSFTLGQVSRDARLLFIGLWTEADDEGRLVDSPKGIAGAVFPHDQDVTDEVLDGWLRELMGVKAIRRYRSGGARYITIPNFTDYQKPPHPTASRIPPPPETRAGVSRNGREPLAPGFGVKGLGLGSGKSRPQTGSPRRRADRSDETKPESRTPEATKFGERMAEFITSSGGRPTDEVFDVADWALRGLDFRFADQLLGGCMDRNGKPRSARYFATALAEQASAAGVHLEPYRRP